MESFNKSRVVDASTIDQSSAFIPVDSVSFRNPGKISLENLFGKINQSIADLQKTIFIANAPSVYSNDFTDQNIYYYLPPLDLSTLTGMHVVTDGNYLYVWVGNRWKRTPLTEW